MNELLGIKVRDSSSFSSSKIMRIQSNLNGFVLEFSRAKPLVLSRGIEHSIEYSNVIEFEREKNYVSSQYEIIKITRKLY